MSEQAGTAPAPLDDVMLAMDVVDTLRHREDLVSRELSEDAREAQLLSRLRQIYHQQGIEVPDAILREGVNALKESRFVYTPPAKSFGVSLARLYVGRRRWGRWVTALVIAGMLGLGAYFFAYLPYTRAQAEAARIELAEGMPAQMDALYDTIYRETKVQTATARAEAIRARGKAAAAEGDRVNAVLAIAQLTELRDTLRQDYTLRVVNRDGVRSGFWTFPEINTEATNYYLVVEALDSQTGQALTLPIASEEDGTTESVALWGIRVPEAVYRAVEADKRDNGIIERNIVGVKAYGFLDVDYAVPVLGGQVTRW